MLHAFSKQGNAFAASSAKKALNISPCAKHKDGVSQTTNLRKGSEMFHASQLHQDLLANFSTILRINTYSRNEGRNLPEIEGTSYPR